MALTSAPYDDPAEGPIVFHFAISLKSEGVRIGDDWDTLGMRATGSNTVIFDKVFVPDAAISAKRPRGKWHPSFSLICIVAVPIYFSAYVGLAEKAVDLAKERSEEAARRSASTLPARRDGERSRHGADGLARNGRLGQ